MMFIGNVMHVLIVDASIIWQWQYEHRSPSLAISDLRMRLLRDEPMLRAEDTEAGYRCMLRSPIGSPSLPRKFALGIRT